MSEKIQNKERENSLLNPEALEENTQQQKEMIAKLEA